MRPKPSDFPSATLGNCSIAIMSAMSARPSQSWNGSDMMHAKRTEEDGAMTFATKSIALCGAAALAGLLLLSQHANAGEDLWPTLKQEAFGDRPIQADD